MKETARLILSTATSDSSSVTVNYLVPIVLFASNSVIRFAIIISTIRVHGHIGYDKKEYLNFDIHLIIGEGSYWHLLLV